MSNIIVFGLSLLLSFNALAQGAVRRNSTPEISMENIENWHDFRARILAERDSERSEGTAYMISGGLLLVGGLIGYHNGNGSLEKLAYSVTQSLGIAGIGFGAYRHYVGGEQRGFFETVENTPGLSIDNKNELVRSYAQTWKINKHNEKWIRVVTHSLVAALNIYTGFREEPGDLRTGLFVIGGANALAALSFSF